MKDIDTMMYEAEMYERQTARNGGMEDRMNAQATTAFITSTARAEILIAAIRDEINDHMGVDPEHVSWANVGDIQHVVDSLEEIARFIGIDT